MRSIKERNLDKPVYDIELDYQNHVEMVKEETRLHKYLDRMYEIVHCRSKKYEIMTKYGIFEELNKVIQCQMNIELNEKALRIEK